MSFIEIKKAIETENITSSEKLVLIILASYADDNCSCYPSYNTLAEQTKYSKRWVMKSVQALEEKGLIKVTKRKINTNENSSNIYKLMLKEDNELNFSYSEVSSRPNEVSSSLSIYAKNSCDNQTSNENHSSSSENERKRRKLTFRGGNNASSPPSEVSSRPNEVSSPKPTNEHIKEYISNNNIHPQSSKNDFNPAISLKNKNVSKDLIDDFLILRKAKKAPVTRTVINQLEKEANKANLDLSEVLEIMVLRNWAGFQADWIQNQNKAKKEIVWKGKDYSGVF